MDKEFIPYKQALELKELGFDEPCFFPFIVIWFLLSIHIRVSIEEKDRNRHEGIKR